jgi:type IV pilus assembly protein PilQ
MVFGLVSCVTIPEGDQESAKQRRAVDLVAITDSADRVKVELEAGGAIAYSLSTGEAPPSATLDLPGHVLGAGLKSMSIAKPPLLELTATETGEPRPGIELRFGLAASVKPVIHSADTRLVVEFPKESPSVSLPAQASAETPAAPLIEAQGKNDIAAAPPATQAPPTREDQEPAQTLTKVEVQRGEQAATVVISGDGRFVYDVKLIDKTRLVLDLFDVSTALRFHVLPVEHPLLKQIRVGRHAEKIRLVLDLAREADYSVKPEARSLIVRLASRPAAIGQESPTDHSPAVAARRAAYLPPAMDAPPEAGTVRIVPASRVPFPERLARAEAALPVAQLAPEAERPATIVPAAEPDEPGAGRYVGRRISLDFQAADISNVLRLIAEVSGFNIVVGESVKAKVTMKLVSVPWDQALDMLLKMNNLGKIREGNIIWIDTLTNIARQQDEEARAKDAKSKAQDLQVETLYIRNVLAQDLQTTLNRYVTPRGYLNVNQAINALVIRDTPDNVTAFKRLVESLDLQSPQIQIEARIVQADTNYTRSLGVQWGVRNLTQLKGGPDNVAQFQSGNIGPFAGQTSDFLVNLPSTPALGAAGFTIGRLTGTGALLDMRLSAGEQLGLTKVLAAPKITTLHNREARITQGESIPFQTTSLQGTQTTFVDANLELQVTPQITSRDPKEQGKLILLRLRATRNAVGPASNPQAGPSILRREAQTQILVRDGETTVLGGIFVETTTTNVDAVPYLSRIPVLGWLFKRKTENVTKQELLIFLTPNIVTT